MAILDLEDLSKLYIASNICRFSTPTASDFGNWVDLTPLLDLQASLLEGSPNEVLYINAAGVATTNSAFTYNETTQIFIVDNTTTDGSYLKVGEGVQAYYTDSGGGLGQISIDRTRAQVAISSTSSGILSLPSSTEAEAVRLYSAKSTGSRTTEIRIIPEYAFLTGASTAGLNIGATDAPEAKLEVQTNFLVTSATANQYFKYDGDTMSIKTVDADDRELIAGLNSSNNKIFSILQDELGSGGFALKNSGGLEIVKINGYLDGHTFFNQKYVSIGRTGVSESYAQGAIDGFKGAQFTISSERWNRNATDDLGEPANYSIHLRDEDAFSGAVIRSLGIAFSTDSTAEDNVGAAIVYTPTAVNSKGELNFYTKRDNVDGTNPELALSINDRGYSIFSGAIQLKSYADAAAIAALGGVADGMLVYNTNTNKVQARAGGAWVDLH